MLTLPTSVRVALLLASLAGSTSCDLPSGIGARLIVISAPARSDTILALPVQRLVVELRDQRNQPVPNALVSFSGRKAQSADSLVGLRGVFACPADHAVCVVWFESLGWVGMGAWTTTTDAQGRAAVRVQFGQVAGLTAIEVMHEESKIQLSVPFETRAGALAGARTPVTDTVIYVGRTYPLAAEAADRLDNPVPGTVTVTALDPAVATYAAGIVTAVSIGRARFAMSAGSATDTAFVSVPPQGRLVAMGPAATEGGTSRLTLVNLDGSARKPLVTTYGHDGFVVPTWAPSADRIIYQERDGPAGNVVLRAVDTLGNASTSFPVTPGVDFAMQPAFSHIEGRLYLFGNSVAGSGIYRVEPDGTGAVYLHPAVQPGPSPDGSKIAFVTGDFVKARDLDSGVESLLGFIGLLPRWSPAGNVVAYINESSGALIVVHPDGTESRRIGETRRYAGMVAFSPDGTWVLAATSVGLELIRISDGLRLPLVTLRGFSQPAWR